MTVSIPCLLKGGTEMQTLQLAKALASQGYHIKVVVYFEYDITIVSEFRSINCDVTLLKLGRDISAFNFIRSLYSFFVTDASEIIHVQYMAPGFLPILAARLAGVNKLIATVHQPRTKSHGLFARMLLLVSSLLCNRFIVVSRNAERSWFGSDWLLDESLPLNEQPKHFTIYNSVDVSRIREIQARTHSEIEKANLGIFTRGPVIGVVSRLRHEKGIDLLVEAFAKALHFDPYLHLLIVGTGPDEIMLKKMVLNSGISSNCTFYGEASWEVAMKIMTLMDIVVVPSRFEGFGLTAAEAMAMKRPLVVSSANGLKELITHKKEGLVFQNGDVNDLCKNLEAILIESNQVQFAANAFDKVKRLFDFPIYKEKIRFLYKCI